VAHTRSRRGRAPSGRDGSLGQPPIDVIEEPTRRLPFPVGKEPGAPEAREWLVTNGLGGYASGTISGVVTRRYHGLLIAALPDPFGRTAMLTHL
jgi:hypothetical protein